MFAAFFNNKITFAKIAVLMLIGGLAILYNVNLFTSDYAAKNNTININDVYYTWDKRDSRLNDIIAVKNRFKKTNINKVKDRTSQKVKKEGKNKHKENPSKVEWISNNSKLQFAKSIENINVKKDELLHIELFTLGKYNKFDTVPEMMIADNKISVEFWKSPINYMGYKREKNKIILFGIEDFDEVNFKFAHSKICLRYKNDFFILNEADIFQPFTPISDKELIAIINEEDEP